MTVVWASENARAAMQRMSRLRRGCGRSGAWVTPRAYRTGPGGPVRCEALARRAQKASTLSRGSFVLSTSPVQLELPAASSADCTRAGMAPGCADLYSAAAPVTCGAAIDVPLRVLNSPSSHVEVMQTPGAMRSTAGPKFEKSASVSSTPARHVGDAPPPGRPLKSA